MRFTMFDQFWKSRFSIAGLALLGGLIGFLGATLWPKKFEVSVVVRSSDPGELIPLSIMMTDMPGEWHQTANMASTAQQIFLQLSRDRNNLESFILHHRSWFAPNLDLNDRKTLTDVMDDLDVSTKRSVIPYLVRKDGAETPSLQFGFTYDEGTRGVEFVNSFVEELISQTSSRLLANARSTLESVKLSKTRELSRRREVRDGQVRQKIFEYEEALATARAAGLEQPAIANLGSTSAVVATSTPMPLYYFGSIILTAELQNFRARIGNDLAIPEYASIKASFGEIDKRMDDLEKLALKPIAITELAVDPVRPKSPRRGLITIIGILLGGLAGCLTVLGRQVRVKIAV